MEVTTREAAELLGVSQAEAGRLARSGLLASRRLGQQWLIDADDLQRRRRTHVSPGRIWSHRTALVALTLLTGGDASTLLSASELSRLRRKLRSMHATDFMRLAGGAMTTQSLRVGAVGVAWLESQVETGDTAFLTSESALHLLDRGLLGGERSAREQQLHLACADADTALLLKGSNGKFAQSAINVVLHVVQGATREHLKSNEIRTALAALSLGQHADARVRTAARTMIERSLQQWAEADASSGRR